MLIHIITAFSLLANTSYEDQITINTNQSKLSNKFSIGNTYYVSTETLLIRGQPNCKSEPFSELHLDYKVVIEEVRKDKWIKISYTNEDVGSSGYVLKKYLSEKKIIR